MKESSEPNTVVNTDPNDPLRLTFCPNCDYSLQTLPEAGVCPECGERYDQSFIVLRGVPANDRDNLALTAGAFTWKRLLWTFASMAALLFLFPRGYQNPLFLFVGGYVLLAVGIGMLTRLDSPRPGEILVWMSPIGIGQQVDADRSSLAAKLRPYVPLVYALGFPLFMILPGVHSQISLIIAGCVVLPIIALSIALNYGGRPRPAMTAEGARPDLIAWTDLKFVELRERSGGRLRIRAHHVSWANRRDVVAIDIDAPPATIAAVRARLRSWAGCEIRER